ncbi:MAG: class I SAM-dependent methyltransferase [Calditrichaeota bacterium]|nr:MAG: class I SAM-dependent methyltransferase [Calditrichota bacterium]
MKKKSLKTQKAYAKWAESYDQCDNPTRDLDHRVIQQLPIELSGKEVIEVGCGTGKNTVWFAEKAKTVVAMDFSHEMLQRAMEKVSDERVTFLQHDIAYPWPLPSESGDFISINLVLEHLRDIDSVLKEAYRVLREGGYLYISELHPAKHKRGTQARFIDPVSYQMVNIESFYHDEEEFLSVGKKVGFRPIKVQDWYDDDAPKDAPPRLLSILFQK